MDTRHPPVGVLIRQWRSRRRLSQLDLALEAEISQRHLSFVESGRAAPSRDMVLNLAEHLDLPLRERNRLLLSAGYAPHFPQRRPDDPELEPMMAAVQKVLKGHEPNPAIAVDRHWHLVSANAAIGVFLACVHDKSLLEPPINGLRLSLHPGGLAPLIENLPEWRAHVLERLRRIYLATGDTGIEDLADELRSYPAPASSGPQSEPHSDIATTLRLKMPDGTRLAFITTITVFGTPLDVAASEIAVESFFAADEATANWLKLNLPAS
jgi:transcriptional regulator with XRE-family HTH domain